VPKISVLGAQVLGRKHAPRPEKYASTAPRAWLGSTRKELELASRGTCAQGDPAARRRRPHPTMGHKVGSVEIVEASAHFGPVIQPNIVVDLAESR
jgi:hypothetical protein